MSSMELLEQRYKQHLENVRNDRSLLTACSYESAKDNTGNQLARKRLLVSLLNFKESSDYDIASYLFDEEVKAKHEFEHIDDYSTDILELSALVLISFNKIEDILRMVDDRPDEHGAHVYIDPRLYILYGYKECHAFLNSSDDIRAKKALENFKKLSEEDSCQYDASELQRYYVGRDGYYGNLYFPLMKDDLIYFCIEMMEIEVLDKEANSWFDAVKEWDEGLVIVGGTISEILENVTFNQKFKTVNEQFVKQKAVQEKDMDDAVSNDTNIFGVFVFVLLLIGFLGVSMMTAVISEIESSTMNQRLGLWGVSLGAALVAAFCIEGLKMTNANDLEYFKKVYISGERTPLLTWEYSDNRWHDFAKNKFERIAKTQRNTLIALVTIGIGLCLFFKEPVLVVIIVWFICLSAIVFLINFRKDYLTKRESYLDASPPTLDVYGKGIVIGKKHYVPFNTRYIWLLGIEMVDKEGIPYLEIKTNPRGGKYPDGNIIYHSYPVPIGKEDEARRYANTR